MSIRIRSANGRMKVTAALNSGGGRSADDIFGQRTSNLLGAELDESMLKDIIKEDDNKELQAIYKDIYFHDAISGGAVDLKATLPWSDFTLVGGDDKVLQHYYDTCSRLNTLSLHPELSVDYMVTGAFVGSLIYDKTTKQLTDMIPYSYADCEIRPVPLYSTEPLLRLLITPELKAFAEDDSDEMRKVHKRVPRSILEHFKNSESVDLDPLSTIYIPRTTLSSYQGGVSMYRRVLPMYLMERVLYRGTVTEASRRQRATLHITAGDENWMPTQADFDGLVGLFQQTERDPLSAIVATHASVQASEVRCLAYEQKVDLDCGLIEIGSMVTHDPDKLKPGTEVKLKDTWALNQKGEYAQVDSWIYQGKKPVVELTLDDGTILKPTRNHKWMVVGKDLSLTLMTTNEVVASGTNLLRVTQVPDTLHDTDLGLEYPDVEYRPANSRFKLPEIMTPDLAYCIGLIISDGYINAKSVEVSNAEPEILERYVKYMESVFGLPVKLGPWVKATEGVIRGEPVFWKKPVAKATINSMHLVGCLRQLGMYPANELRTKTHSPSYAKSVPSVLLRSNTECKLAFLSGYIDGDGSSKSEGIEGVRGHTLSWCSTSHSVVKTIHELLVSLGVGAKVYYGDITERQVSGCWIPTGQSSEFAHRLDTIRHNKEFGNHGTRKHGVPGIMVVQALEERLVSDRNFQLNGVRGALFLNDDGEEVFIAGGYTTLFKHQKYSGSPFYYRDFKLGKYNQHLKLIRKVSASLYQKVMRLLTREYQFLSVAHYEELPEQPVYDLHMEESSAPLFCVNGVVSKNSGGDFWKWTDVTDQLGDMKMRALGINDSFLSGDMNYSTMETALTVFIEDLRTFRDRITRMFYYEKIFPLVAFLNNIRTEDINKKNKKETAAKYLSDVGSKLNNATDWWVPQIQWHKQLRPEADREYMDILDALEQRGLPITMRMLAAAGGINLDQLVSDLGEDKKMREQIKAITGRDSDDEDEDEDEDEYASLLGKYHGMSHVGLLNRDYGEESMELASLGRTGKKHYQFDQLGARNRLRDNFAKAMSELSDRSNYDRVANRIKHKVKGV